MAKSIGGKPWYKINTGYYQLTNGQQVAVKPGATYKGYAAVPNNGLCWQARRLLIATNISLEKTWWQLSNSTVYGRSSSDGAPCLMRMHEMR